MFLLYKNLDSQVLIGNLTDKIYLHHFFGIEVEKEYIRNKNITYDKNLKEITIKKQGLYFISCDFYGTINGQGSASINIRHNDDIIAFTNGYGTRASLTALDYCNENDTIKVVTGPEYPLLLNISCCLL